jgi:hypothetical protein
MRVLVKIAAFLMLMLMMPLPPACAVVALSGKIQRACCKPHIADRCCEGSAKVCGAAQTATDTMLYPAQSSLPLFVPAVTVAVVPTDGVGCSNVRCVRLDRPAQHSPPGLLIAATIVLRV